MKTAIMPRLTDAPYEHLTSVDDSINVSPADGSPDPSADLEVATRSGGISHAQYGPDFAEGKVPTYRAVFLIANAALGAGLLNFPQAYMKAGGIKVAISMQATLLIFIVGAFLILARCANACKGATYQDVILHMLGRHVRNVCQVLIAIYFFGSVITYIIIIGEQLGSVLHLAVGKEAWYVDHRFCGIVFSLIFLLPLCLPKSLGPLSYTSFFGGFGAFFITFVIIFNYASGKYPSPAEMQPTGTDWKDAFAAIPVICFGFQCHVSAVPVYAELKNRSIMKFFCCSFLAMIICMITYSLSGAFGYLTFGSKTYSDVLTNYDAKDTLVNVARVAIVLILLSAFAISTICARTVLDGIVLSFWNASQDRIERTEKKRRVIETLFWFAFSLLLASVVPNIGVAIALIGGIASTFIFVFPGLMLLKTVDVSAPKKLSTHDWLTILIGASYLVLGFFIFGEVTTLALFNDISGRQVY